MIRLLHFEIFKMLRQPKVWITFGVLAVIMFLINFGLATEGDAYIDILLQPLIDQFFIQGNIINGFLIAYISLNMLWVHIPILQVIVTTDLVSGEFESGTIRLILCGKWKRWQWLGAKIVAALIYVSVFMLLAGALMIIPSTIIFGRGDLLVFFNGIQVLEQSEIVGRFLLALAFGSLGMLTFSMLSMLFAVYLRNTLAAILTSLAILVISTLLQTFAFGVFDRWKPGLFTYHMAQWQLFFVKEIDWGQIANSAMVLVLHMLIALGLMVYRFQRMKITE